MFVRAVQGKENSVIYIAGDGTRMIRKGGKWTWRNNNPGNLNKGPKSRSLGSIGVAGGFAVFPDYKTGRKALKAVLETTYYHWSLFRLVEKYAPPEDNNDVENYRKLLRKFTGIDLKRTVRTLNAKEMESLMNAIERIEGGSDPGEEVQLGPAKKIIDVKRNKKNRITGYLIEDLGMLSPAATLNGILSGEIDGVVADRGGRTYVRTRPDPVLENNLDTKGRR